jgi:hypothetical protein
VEIYVCGAAYLTDEVIFWFLDLKCFGKYSWELNTDLGSKEKVN